MEMRLSRAYGLATGAKSGEYVPDEGTLGATGAYSMNNALVGEVWGGEASKARFIREPKWDRRIDNKSLLL